MSKDSTKKVIIEPADKERDCGLHGQINYMPYGVKAGVEYEIDPETRLPKRYYYYVLLNKGSIVSISETNAYDVCVGIWANLLDRVVGTIMYSYEKDLDKKLGTAK